MATASRTNGDRKSTASAVPIVRVPRQHDNSNQNALAKVNYPILFVGSVAAAIAIFWMREKTINTHTSEPILTVRPSTDADVSTIQNIQHLVEFDQSKLDAANNVPTGSMGPIGHPLGFVINGIGYGGDPTGH